MPARNSGKSDVEARVSAEQGSSNLPILCDRKGCRDYGDRPRCYLDIFKDCPDYNGERKIKNLFWV